MLPGVSGSRSSYSQPGFGCLGGGGFAPFIDEYSQNGDNRRKQLVLQAMRHGLPAAYASREYAEAPLC